MTRTKKIEKKEERIFNSVLKYRVISVLFVHEILLTFSYFFIIIVIPRLSK